MLKSLQFYWKSLCLQAFISLQQWNKWLRFCCHKNNFKETYWFELETTTSLFEIIPISSETRGHWIWLISYSSLFSISNFVLQSKETSKSSQQRTQSKQRWKIPWQHKVVKRYSFDCSVDGIFIHWPVLCQQVSGISTSDIFYFTVFLKVRKNPLFLFYSIP